MANKTTPKKPPAGKKAARPVGNSKSGKERTAKKALPGSSAAQKKDSAKGSVTPSGGKKKAAKKPPARSKSAAGKASASEKGTGAKASGKSSAAARRPQACPKPSAAVPAPSSRTDFIDIIKACPKIAGTLERPEYRRREGEHFVGVTVEDERRDLVVPLFDYPRGQRVVAIIVPIQNTSESAPWLELNPDKPLAAPKPSGFQETYEVRVLFMADVLGINKRTLQLLGGKHPEIKLGRGRYDLIATVKARLVELEAEYKGRGGKQYSDARTRDKEIEGSIKEVNLLEKCGALVPFEEVQALAQKTGLEYRRAIENLPARLAAELSAAKTPAAARRILEKEIKTILMALTKNSTTTTTRKQLTNGSDRRTHKQARKRK